MPNIQKRWQTDHSAGLGPNLASCQKASCFNHVVFLRPPPLLVALHLGALKGPTDFLRVSEAKFLKLHKLVDKAAQTAATACGARIEPPGIPSVGRLKGEGRRFFGRKRRQRHIPFVLIRDAFVFVCSFLRAKHGGSLSQLDKASWPLKLV